MGTRVQRALGPLFVLLWSSGYLAAAVGDPGRAAVRPHRLAVPARRAAAGRDRRRDAGAVAARTAGLARPRRRRGCCCRVCSSARPTAGWRSGVPAGLAALVLCLAPALVAVASGPVLGERLGRTGWWGSGLALVGALGGGRATTSSRAAARSRARPARAGAARVRERHALPEAGGRHDGPAHRHRRAAARGRGGRAPVARRDRARPAVPDGPARAGRVGVDRRGRTPIAGAVLLFVLLRRGSGAGGAAGCCYLRASGRPRCSPCRVLGRAARTACTGRRDRGDARGGRAGDTVRVELSGRDAGDSAVRPPRRSSVRAASAGSRSASCSAGARAGERRGDRGLRGEPGQRDGGRRRTPCAAATSSSTASTASPRSSR